MFEIYINLARIILIFIIMLGIREAEMLAS